MVEIEHLLVMQHFRLVYFRRVCVPENISDKWTFHSYTMRKGYIAILYDAIQNTVARWEGWV